MGLLPQKTFAKNIYIYNFEYCDTVFIVWPFIGAALFILPQAVKYVCIMCNHWQDHVLLELAFLEDARENSLWMYDVKRRSV